WKKSFAYAKGKVNPRHPLLNFSGKPNTSSFNALVTIPPSGCFQPATETWKNPITVPENPPIIAQMVPIIRCQRAMSITIFGPYTIGKKSRALPLYKNQHYQALLKFKQKV